MDSRPWQRRGQAKPVARWLVVCWIVWAYLSPRFLAFSVPSENIGAEQISSIEPITSFLYPSPRNFLLSIASHSAKHHFSLNTGRI